MTRQLKKEAGMAPIAFSVTLGMAILLFLPYVIYDGGYFIYYGDFNAQQIPFYRLAHEAVRSGNIGWSWTTDLGANFVGSYSFYLLGSPFFWLTLLFPSAAVPYLMAPLLALKIAFAGTAAYAYTRRFLRPQLAVIAGVLYAFCGFSMFNIFFNHFHEAMIWLPLMLLGIEQYMQEGKRGLFALTVFASALSNYYFFIGQALFVMIYWVLRVLSGEWQQPVRRFFGLWWQALIGVAAAAVLLLPSFYAVIQNSRVETSLSGFGFLIYGTGQRLYDIIHSFFFPPELPARANFFPDANNKWASMSAWIPVFGFTGVFAYFQSRKHTDWLRRLLIVLFCCALIPGLNAAFQLFNQVYYARWYYMMVLVMILATLRCFEEEQTVDWKRAILWSAVVTVFFAVFIGLIPTSWTPDEETGKFTIGLEKEPAWFWLYIGIAILCLALTRLFVQLWQRQSVSSCIAVCVLLSLGFGWTYLTMGKCIANYPSDYVTDKLIEHPGFTLPDSDEFSRIDIYEGMDNQGMYWNMPCIQAFHSIVPGSVMEFYNSIDVPRSVGSRPKAEVYSIRGLLSVRWLFDYAQNGGDIQLYNKNEKEDFFIQDGQPAIDGFVYYDTQNGFHIYENENYIPMGFTYEGYITRTEYDELAARMRQQVLLKALIVEDEDVANISLPHLDVDTMFFTAADYPADCRQLRNTAASAFTTDNDGFSATISLPEDNLVFFSVPYEEGWSATVNGQPAEIRKVNVGFMAVACPAGEDAVIRFDYKTPGLRTGVYISLGGLLLLVIHLLRSLRHNRRLCRMEKVLLPADAALLSSAQPPVVQLGPDDIDPFSIYQPPISPEK